MRPFHFYASLMILLILACTRDQNSFSADLDSKLTDNLIRISPESSLEYFKLPAYNNLVRIPQDPLNPLSPAKVELGQYLFFETGIAINAENPSGEYSYSCASCHILDAGFTPGQVQGIGDGGLGYGVKGEGRHKNPDYHLSELDIQSIRPLSLVNVAFVKNTFWNGQFGSENVNVGTEDLWDNRSDTKLNELGYKSIETQNIIGLNSHRFKIDKSKVEAYGYKTLFDTAFPEFKEEFRYSTRAASLAISAFIRTIVASDAPFQQWLDGETNIMSDDEKEGALLFFGKAKCFSCHYEKNLGSHEFHVLGTKDMDQNDNCFLASAEDRRNDGRAGFTLKDEDLNKFRVPGLYNVSDYGFYFHGSSKKSITEVIDYKIQAIAENPRVNESQISEKFNPIYLTDSEKEKL